MNSIEQFKKELAQLAGKSRYEIMTETTAIFTIIMESYGIMPVVVGGLAVEIYTRGQYTTLDIDMVMHNRELAGEALARLGFIQEGRHWYHEELEVAIEIPNDVLEGADREKIIKIHLPSGKYLYVIGIEDIIMDRLRACVHWRSTSDCEWGLRMLKVHHESLDLDYLRAMAKKDHVTTSNKLAEWLMEAIEE